MKKRLFGLLITVALLLCVAVPLAAMAVSELQWIEVTGVQNPVVGEMPSVEDIVVNWPEDQQGALTSAAWYYYDDMNGYTELTEPFYGGATFTLRLTLELPEDVELGYMTEYIVPEEADSCFPWFNMIELEYYVPGEPVEAVFANGIPTAIQPGQQASVEEITIPEDANYTLDVYWQSYGMFGWENFDGTFEDGAIYRLYFEFYVNPGYEFDMSDVYFNGEYTDYNGQSNSWIGVDMLFPLSQEITTVELLNMPEPMVGEQADLSGLTVPENANYYIDYAFWLDVNYEQYTGTFAQGQDYQLNVKLIPKEGYHFAEDVVLAVDGNVREINWYDIKELFYTEDVSFKEVIDTIAVTGYVEPVIGEAPATENMAAEHCTVMAQWVDQNYEPISVFEDGKRYALIIQVFPDEGYKFDPSVTTVTIDGGLMTRWQVESDYAMIFLTKSFCRPVTAVSVNVPEVVVGQPVFFEAEVPADANYYTTISWYTWDEQNGYVFYEGETFESGKMYDMDLYIFPNENYGFDPQVQVNITGADPMISVSESEIYCLMNYDFSSTPKIEKIELTVPVPEVGKPATAEGIEVPADAHYTVLYAQWMETDASSEDIMSSVFVPAESFKTGKRYVLAVELGAQSGYVFNWRLPVYVNGEQIDVLVYGSDCFGCVIIPVLFDLAQSGDVPGDINGSGSATNDDVIALMWHVLFPEENPITIDGDLNKDGSVDNNDVIALMWYVLFPEEYPL